MTPTGQYDPKRVINIGTNCWAFKPEVAVSRALGRWALEGAFGVWLYTTNSQFYGNSTRTQNPLWSGQAHVVRLIRSRHWFAYDFTYFRGGRHHGKRGAHPIPTRPTPAWDSLTGSASQPAKPYVSAVSRESPPASARISAPSALLTSSSGLPGAKAVHNFFRLS